MSGKAQVQAIDAELRSLWSRRADLDEQEMTRLCEIVLAVLRPCQPRELAGLPEDNEVYVIGFIEAKVLRRDLLGQCDHAGALQSYYRNYLRDLIRAEKRRAEFEVQDSHCSQEEGDLSSHVDDAPDLTEQQSDVLTALEEAGHSIRSVSDSALAWLESSEEWVRLFVAFSNCPDADVSEPLIKLARRRGIKSHAYKAEKLGFNWRGNDLEGFGQTLLGQWILSLGIELVPDNTNLILGALKILCLVALNWADTQEAAA